MPENIPDGVNPNAACAKVMTETVHDAVTKRNSKLRSRQRQTVFCKTGIR